MILLKRFVARGGVRAPVVAKIHFVTGGKATDPHPPSVAWREGARPQKPLNPLFDARTPTITLPHKSH